MNYISIQKQIINYLKKCNYSKKQLEPLAYTSTLNSLLFHTIELTSKTTGHYQWSKIRLSHSHAIVNTYDNVIHTLLDIEKSNNPDISLSTCEMELLDLDETYHDDICCGLLLHDIFKYLDNGIEHGENAANALEGQLESCVIDAIKYHSHKTETFDSPLINLFMDLDRLSKLNELFIADCIKYNKDCIGYMYKKVLEYNFKLDICTELFDIASPTILNLLVEK